MRWTVFGIVLFIFSGSCSSDDFDNQGILGLNYYPLEVGDTRIYDVLEVQFTVDGVIDSTSYQLRHKVINKLEEDDIFEIQVSSRINESEGWNSVANYQSWIESGIAILNQGAASYIKLSFPVEKGRTWDGNSLNIFEEDLYTLDSINFAFSVNGAGYDNTLTVIQEYTIDPIQITADDVALEVYAWDIGLIYKEQRFLQYKSCGTLNPECCGAGGTQQCFGEIDEGRILIQSLKSFEKN